jgi:hypothetical protein
MPELPPRGDPQRPLYLAIRSMRLLGLVFVVFGLVAVVLAWLALGRLINTPTVSWLGLAMAALIYFIPGVLYFVFAIFLTHRQSWAVAGGMVVAIVQFPFALLALVTVIVRGVHAFPLLLAGLWVAALIQLIYHLSKSRQALRLEAVTGARGFETLPPQIVPPAPMAPPPAMVAASQSPPPPPPPPGQRI